MAGRGAGAVRKDVQPFKPVEDPLFAVDVKGATVLNWMAFDPLYGPESQKQIDWHIKHGTPGAQTWQVGVPCNGPGFRAKKKRWEPGDNDFADEETG